MSYAEAVRRVEDTSRVGQVRAESINKRQIKEGEMFNSDDVMVVVNKKMLLAFMVEAMWRVKMVANKKSDVAREITTAAEQLLGFKGIDPKEVWKAAFSQNKDRHTRNGGQELQLGTDLEEMDSRDGDYDED